MYGLSLT